MAIVAKSGTATVKVEMDTVLMIADRIHDGAATTFLRAAHRQMDPTLVDAAASWMERTGLSKRSFVARDDISEDRIKVTALNTAKNAGYPYPYVVKFSNRTKASIDAEVARFVNANPLDADETLQQTKMAIAISKRTKARASPSAIGAMKRAALFHDHGHGAPSAALAGRPAWSWLVRRVVKQREKALIEEARDALDKLAQG